MGKVPEGSGLRKAHRKRILPTEVSAPSVARGEFTIIVQMMLRGVFSLRQQNQNHLSFNPLFLQQLESFQKISI